jgi:hypothetical protein
MSSPRGWSTKPARRRPAFSRQPRSGDRLRTQSWALRRVRNRRRDRLRRQRPRGLRGGRACGASVTGPAADGRRPGPRRRGRCDAVPLDDLGASWVLWNGGSTRHRVARCAGWPRACPRDRSKSPAFAGYAWFGHALDTRRPRHRLVHESRPSAPPTLRARRQPLPHGLTPASPSPGNGAPSPPARRPRRGWRASTGWPTVSTDSACLNQVIHRGSRGLSRSRSARGGCSRGAAGGRPSPRRGPAR